MIQSTIKTRVVGVGLSIDETIFAIVDLRGNIIAKDSFPTTDFPNVNDFITYLSERIVALVEANGGFESVRSVGISSPSGNFRTGCIEYPPNMPWKGQIPMAAMLRDRLGLAVALGNDAHVRALGEYVFGSAHGLQDFLYMDKSLWLEKSADERINVPGTVTQFNWTYRLPCTLEELSENQELINKIKKISSR